MLGTVSRTIAALLAIALLTTSCANTMAGIGEDTSSFGKTIGTIPRRPSAPWAARAQAPSSRGSRERAVVGSSVRR